MPCTMLRTLAYGARINPETVRPKNAFVSKSPNVRAENCPLLFTKRFTENETESDYSVIKKKFAEKKRPPSIWPRPYAPTLTLSHLHLRIMMIPIIHQRNRLVRLILAV